MIPAPVPATVNVPTGLQLYALLGAAAVAIAAAGVVIVVLATGHDLSDPRVIEVLGFASSIFIALLGFAGLGGAVQNVHLSVNSRLDQLVKTTASDSYQAGQAAGPGPVPTNPTAPLAPPSGGDPTSVT
jgi:hypothetical protein